jgi:large subunit ribosomal protein L10
VTVSEKHIPEWKLKEVEKLATMIKESQMIGLVNVEGVGSKQLQGIRDNLRNSAIIRMARNTLMIRALEEVKKKGIKDLIEYVKGPVSFIFSNQDPFVLSKFLSENKAAAPAKGGQIAPKNIMVPAMNTGVAPGPFISELAGLKIPSRVKGGVIHITEDTVAVKEGDTISNAMAQMLSRLGIEPMELQLKLIAAYTDGTVLTADSFEIDLQDILDEFILGHQYAVNLSINTAYPTDETVPILLAKANVEAKSLTLNIGYFVPEMLGEFLAKANVEMYALAAHLSQIDPEAIPSDLLSQISQVSADAATTTESEKTEAPAEEPEEEEEEEEAVTGLGGLFG